jgi:PST family polysaccharide transporter
MFYKVEKILLSPTYKTLVENFLSLSFLQVANYIFPLITLPYLVRVLGPEKYGLIAFAQAFIGYFQILTDYGFNLSATREISINRENKEKVSEIFSSVMIIKFFLLLVSFVLMSAIVFSFGKFRQNWLIYYSTFGMVLGQTLFPIWFFQGMEKMKYITFLNVLSKFIFTVATFAFIRRASDFLYVPLLNSSGFIISGIISIWLIVTNFCVKMRVPRLEVILKYFKDSTLFFLSRVSVSVYTFTNTFVLGLFKSTQEVGYYSVAEKLYIALQQIYQPVGNTLYPYVAHKKNIWLYRRIFKVIFFFNFIIALVLFVLAKQIINIIFGTNLDISASIFRILLLSYIVVVPSILLGYPLLAAMGFPIYANISVVAGSFLHLVGLVILFYLNLINVYSISAMVFATESFVLMIRVYGVIKGNLWKYNQ